MTTEKLEQKLKIERMLLATIERNKLLKTVEDRHLDLRLYASKCLCNTNTLNLLELNRFTGYDVEQATEEEQDKFFDKIEKRLANILGKNNAEKCFINHDPRGYALKIKEEHSKGFYNQDWGGYGILAPDFREVK